jgi:broad specificity phosphatase PhoE
MRLILCRHGESDGNAAMLSQGFTPGRLTHRGAAQACRLGSLLREQVVEHRAFDEIWSSDSLRALQTCALALMHLLDTESHPVLVDSLLREKNAGVFEGKPRSQISIARKRFGHERLFKPQGGESWGDLQKRAVRFLTMLRERFDGGDAHVLVLNRAALHVRPVPMAALQDTDLRFLPTVDSLRSSSTRSLARQAGLQWRTNSMHACTRATHRLARMVLYATCHSCSKEYPNKAKNGCVYVFDVWDDHVISLHARTRIHPT